MKTMQKHALLTLVALVVLAAISALAEADVVTDWNITAGDIVVAARIPPPPAYRVMAMVQTAVYEAVSYKWRATGCCPGRVGRGCGCGGEPRGPVEAGAVAAGRD